MNVKNAIKFVLLLMLLLISAISAFCMHKNYKSDNRLKITYWIDYACPYSYIAQKRLETALSELEYNINDIDLDVKAFEMDPNASFDVVSKTDERFSKKYGISIEEARNRIEYISQMGKNEGLDFKYSNTQYTNTLNAHRLTKLAASKGDKLNTNKIVNKIFDAYFVKNQKLSDKTTLKNLAQEVGISKEETEQMLNSDIYINDVRNDEQEAYKKNIHSVPYFIINDKEIIPYAQSVEEIKQTIIKVTNHKEKPRKEASMRVELIPVTDVFTTNSYFYIDENTKHGFLIDPGAQAQTLLSIIKQNNLTIEAILLTHGHFDHLGAVDEISNTLKIPYLIHQNGEQFLKSTHYNLSKYNNRNIILNNAKYVKDGDFISLKANNNVKLQVIHTPGHTPDSVVFYDKEKGIAFVGDTIFKGSIGNSQYPGGNAQELSANIINKIFALPHETILYSGHSDKTTVKTEKLRYMR